MYFSTILTFVATTLLAATTAQAGNFGATCNSIQLEGNNVLSATCKNFGGGDSRSSIDMNACVMNNGGKLLCESNGKYAESCTSCWLSGTTMTCGCTGLRSTIDLNQCITNNNGILSCP